MAEPTTAPNPASAAPPVVGAETTPGAPPVSDIADVYGDFDTADRESAPPPPPAKEAAKPAPPRESADAKTATKPSAKAADADTAGKAKDASASNAGSEEGKGKDFKGLTDEEYAKLDKPTRVAYNASLRQQNSKLEEQLRAMRSEVEKVKTARPVEDGRVKELQQILEAKDKRLKDVEDHLRLTAYEKSEEFKEKYQKPYMSAYGMGRNKAASMRTVERKNDMDEVIQASRQGTAEDFDAIMRIPDDDSAYEMAERLFGVKAMGVMHYRERVQELHSQSQEAIQERRSKAELIEKETTEAQKRQAEESEAESKQRAELFRKSVEDGQKAHPDWFSADEGDEEGKATTEAGKAVADSLFSGVNPRTGKPYTKEGMVKFHAFVRNAVAAHGPILHRLKAAQTRIGQLEAQLSEFKDSATLEDAGRRGDSDKGAGLPGPEEFFEVDKASR